MWSPSCWAHATMVPGSRFAFAIDAEPSSEAMTKPASISNTGGAGPRSLLESQVLTLTRDYTYDSTLVLGKAREEELLREAIVKDLVRIVLKQISTL